MANFKIRKKINNRIIAGVCSGISHAIGIDPMWIRLTFIILTITAFPWLLFAYFIAALIIPKEESETVSEFKKVYKIKEGRKIGGVCTGLEKYFNIDVVAIRLGFVLSAFFGFGLLLYLILLIITPHYKSVVPAVA